VTLFPAGRLQIYAGKWQLISALKSTGSLPMIRAQESPRGRNTLDGNAADSDPCEPNPGSRVYRLEGCPVLVSHTGLELIQPYEQFVPIPEAKNFDGVLTL
jgi:hypothetical protein